MFDPDEKCVVCSDEGRGAHFGKHCNELIWVRTVGDCLLRFGICGQAEIDERRSWICVGCYELLVNSDRALLILDDTVAMLMRRKKSDAGPSSDVRKGCGQTDKVAGFKLDSNSTSVIHHEKPKKMTGQTKNKPDVSRPPAFGDVSTGEWDDDRDDAAGDDLIDGYVEEDDNNPAPWNKGGVVRAKAGGKPAVALGKTKRCPVCEEDLPFAGKRDKTRFDEHVRQHGDESVTEAEDDDDGTRNEDAPAASGVPPIQVSGGLFACRVCPRRFTRKSGVLRHEYKAHGSLSTSPESENMAVAVPRPVASQAPKTTRSGRPVVVPVAKFSPWPSSEPEGNGVFVCDLCPRAFPSPMGLTVHKSWVHRESNHRPKAGARRAASVAPSTSKWRPGGKPGSLVASKTRATSVVVGGSAPKHKNRRRNGTGNFPCPVCFVGLSTAASRDRHERSQHEQKRHLAARAGQQPRTSGSRRYSAGPSRPLKPSRNKAASRGKMAAAARARSHTVETNGMSMFEHSIELSDQEGGENVDEEEEQYPWCCPRCPAKFAASDFFIAHIRAHE